MNKQADSLCNQHLGDDYSVSPIRNNWKKLLGYDSAMTRPYVVEVNDKKYKLVVLDGEHEKSDASKHKFKTYQKLYESLHHSGYLPMLLASNDVSMLLEWCVGKTLLERKPENTCEIDSLIDCFTSPYESMVKMPNEYTRENLIYILRGIHESSLVLDSEYASIKQLLHEIKFPSVVEQGPCFSDVSMPNFLLCEDNTVKYIDTMGCVENDYMAINIIKIFNKIDPVMRDYFLNTIHERYIELSDFHEWAMTATLLRQIKAKSKKGTRMLKMNRSRKCKLYTQQLINMSNKYK